MVIAIFSAFLPVFSVNAAEELPYPEELFDLVVTSLSNDELEIDVSEYNITVSQAATLAQDLHDRAPQFFYLENGFSYSYWGNYVYSLYFEYAITDKTERDAAIKFVNDKLDAIVETLPSGLDDFEKALYFHDYLCVNFQYDTDYAIYDVYNMFKYGKGVCQAYTGIYDLLLERVGIKNSTASTSDHIWNLVYLEGDWYHIDVTWGDPLADTFGRACHDDFLRSDSRFESSHGSFYSNFSASDDSYDEISWRNTWISFGFSDGKTYMLDGKEIKEIDIHTDKTETVYTIEESWKLNGYYYGVNSGFGSYKDKLIFNTPDSVMYLDPESGEAKVLETPDIGSGNAIFDLYVSGNTVYYLYGSDYNADNIGSFDIVFEEESEKDPYDINGDGKFNMFDYLMVKSFYFNLNNPTQADLERADLNGNGKVDMFDYMIVKSAYLNK